MASDWADERAATTLGEPWDAADRERVRELAAELRAAREMGVRESAAWLLSRPVAHARTAAGPTLATLAREMIEALLTPKG